MSHALRVIRNFLINHSIIKSTPSLAKAHTIAIGLYVSADDVIVTGCQFGHSCGEPVEASVLNSATTSIIDTVWRAFDQLACLRWVNVECPQEVLRHIFPEYVVGTSTYGRRDLHDQLVRTAVEGSSAWPLPHLNQNPGRASPLNGFAPIVSGILSLYSDMDMKAISQCIHQLLASNNGAAKLECVSFLLMQLATKAHSKHRVGANPVPETVVDSECRITHGRPVKYDVGPHTIIEVVIRTLFTNLPASGWAIPWPSEKHGWSDGQPLPRIVYAWEQAKGTDIIPSFETRFAACNGILRKQADVAPPWAQLLNNPGLVVFRRQRAPTAPYHSQALSSAAVRVKTNASRAQLKALNQLFPYTSHTDKNHMTVHLADVVYEIIHYPEITITTPLLRCGQLGVEQLQPSKASRANLLNKILSKIPLGTNNILAMQVLLASFGSPYSNYAYKAFCELPLLCGSSNEVLARLKALSYLARRGQADAEGRPCPDRAVSFLAYAELAFGRSGNVTDWAEEYSNRCLHTIHIQQPSPLKIGGADGVGRVVWAPDAEILDSKTRIEDPTFYAKLRAHIREICRPLVTRRATTETMHDFLLRRAEWMASGSSGGGSLNLADIPSYAARQRKRGHDCSTTKVKIAKRAWAETVPMADLIREFRTGLPREAAQASEKFENGKSRAIYGVEPIHYIINTYATKGFEEKLHNIQGLEKGVTGIQQSQLEHHRALITSDRKQHCSMLDYADFNRHHTPKAQSIIFEELADLGEGVGACSDWQFANRWVARAKYYMTARFPGKSRPSKVRQGMFSGTKSTDLINTILNLAYFRVAQDYVAEQYGVLSEDLYHVHQGDDVWLSNKNHLWARLLYYTMHQMGFIFQRSKQMFGEGRGEYLRVLYQNGQASGYLHRALANYILRPLQNDSTQDPVAWANTIQEGVATMCRRGLPVSLAKCIWRNSMNYWVKVKAHNFDRCGVRVPIEAIELAAEQGGLGCPRPSHLVLSNSAIVLPVLIANGKVLEGAPAHMTNDWLRHVSAHSSKLEALYSIRADALREMSLRTSYASLPQHVLRADDWGEFKEAMRSWSQSSGRKLARSCQRYRCRDSRDLSYAVSTHYGTPKCDTASNPLLQNIAQVECSPATPATEYMGLSNTLSKIVASSRFKSISSTATAYGMTHQQALTAILAAAGEDSSASQDTRYDIQHILQHPNPDSLALLQRPGTSLVSALSPFIDANLSVYCSSQHNQVLAKYLATFGVDPRGARAKQAAIVMQLTANTITAQEPVFKRIRY